MTVDDCNANEPAVRGRTQKSKNIRPSSGDERELRTHGVAYSDNNNLRSTDDKQSYTVKILYINDYN